jgi:hypothetical protein
MTSSPATGGSGSSAGGLGAPSGSPAGSGISGNGAVMDSGGRARFLFWLQQDYAGLDGGKGGS